MQKARLKRKVNKYMNFKELELDENIVKAVEEMGFETATDIQARAIPLVMTGKDMIGRSSTGTGKTAAFGIPCIQMAHQNAWAKSSVLILSPTRELAVQISEELRKFSKYMGGVSVATVYGGQPMDGQIRQLKTAKIVVGTPGRIMDHLRRKTLKLDNLKTVVLDEADEMLNMGFHEDIVTILTGAPEDRQTVLFSATMPPAILRLTKDFQRDPELVAVDGGVKTAINIEQSYFVVPQSGKNDAVKLLLEFHKPKRALIFVNTKKMADELSASLNDVGFKSTALHGDLKQSQRNTVMQEFKAGRSRILIATDVAARGIDVEGIEAVINYDIPQDNEYYVHRIGRTGRAGNKGASFTLAANRGQIMRIRDIERFLKTSIKEDAIPSLESILESQKEKQSESIKKMLGEKADDSSRAFIEGLVAEGFDAIEVAAILYAKTLSKNTRLARVNNIKKSDAPKRAATNNFSRNSEGRVWVKVDIGNNDKIGPNFIVGAIVEATTLSASAIGKINVFNDYADIDMTKEDAAEVIRTMVGTKIRQKPVVFSLSDKTSSPSGSSDFGRRRGGSSNGGYRGGSNGYRGGQGGSRSGGAGGTGGQRSRRTFSDKSFEK